MLSNAYFLAKFRFDTAENEPAINLQNFAKKVAKFANVANPNPRYQHAVLSGVVGDPWAAELREDFMQVLSAEGPLGLAGR